MSFPEPTPATDDFHADLPQMSKASNTMTGLAGLSQEEHKAILGPVDSVVGANLGLPSFGTLSTFLTVALRHAIDKFAADLDAQSVATARAERLFWHADDELRVKTEGIRDGRGQRPGPAVV